MKKIRLALLVNRFPAISETFIFNKAVHLSRAGLDVNVWAHSLKNDREAFKDGLDGLPQGCIRQAPSAFGFWGWILNFLLLCIMHPRRSLQVLQRALNTHKGFDKKLRSWMLALPLFVEDYDIIHFEFSGIASVYLDALPLLSPAKLVVSSRGAAEQIVPLLEPRRAAILREIFSRVDAAHCVSQDIQRTCQAYGLSPQKAFINHPAIDTDMFRRPAAYLQKQNAPPFFLSVGRLHWKKGFEFALLAMKQLADEKLDFEYHIIGEGPEEEKIRFLIRALGLDHQVKIHGGQPAEFVRNLLSMADVFLLPSLSEGLSNAALEAMAMEVPVISTNAGGMAEAIVDQVNGFLIPPMRPDLMAASIKQVLRDADLAAQMGRRGAERVRKDFNIQKQTAIFVHQYRLLVNAAR